jgi:hypothetical protein
MGGFRAENFLAKRPRFFIVLIHLRITVGIKARDANSRSTAAIACSRV